MRGFETGRPDSRSDSEEPQPSFDPERLINTTIERARRAAEEEYGGGLVFVEEVTDPDDGSLEAIVFAQPGQAGDPSSPRVLVRMSRAGNGLWQSERLVPVDSVSETGRDSN